jgi:hypothetical protein
VGETLDFVANFPNPFGKDNRAKADAILAKPISLWTPDSDDFELVVRASRRSRKLPAAAIPVVSNLEAILGLVYTRQAGGRLEKRAPGTVSRVNLLAHGSRGSIGLAGSIYRGVANWTFGGTDLTPQRIDDTAARGFKLGKGGKARAVSAADVRKRMARDGAVYLYSCQGGTATGASNAGNRPQLLKSLAKLFGVKAYGYSLDIRYEVQINSLDDPPGKWAWRLCLPGGACTRRLDIYELDGLGTAAGQLLSESP